MFSISFRFKQIKTDLHHDLKLVFKTSSGSKPSLKQEAVNTDGHLADVKWMQRSATDDHLKTFAVRRDFGYLLVNASDEVSIAARQQSVLRTIIMWSCHRSNLLLFLRTIIHKSQPNSLITLTFWSQSVDRCIKIRKNWVPVSSDEGLVMRPNVKVIKEFGCDLWIIVRKLLYQPNESIPRNLILKSALYI